MQPWTNRPDRDPRDSQIQIVRSRPGRAIGGIITAADIEGAYTHYWRGRTVICQHPLCEACDAHRTPRWYGFASVYCPGTHATGMYEITPTCVPTIDDYLKTYGTLRGAALTLQRANNKINSRVCCTLKTSGYDDSKLPPPPNVRLQLCRIWEIDPASLQDNPSSAPRPQVRSNGKAETPR